MSGTFISKHSGIRNNSLSPFAKKSKGKKDACYRKAKAKFDVFPSAYASGAIAKCRKQRGKKK